MKLIQRYACEICGAEYQDALQAKDCEARGDPSRSVEVGDIVLATAGFTWYDGDRGWIENPNVLLKSNGARCPNGDRNCFSECCTYQFYYAVTAIDRDPNDGHRLRYHLATKAMLTSYRQGFTFDRGHYLLRKVSNPPSFVIDTSRELIGSTCDHLL